MEVRAADDLQAIFAANYDYVWCSLRRLGVHARDLEDVTHDLFLEVSRKLDRWDRARPLRPWLFAFAVRCAADYRRLARHRTELTSSPDVTDDTTAEDIVAQKDTQRLVAAALDGLGLELRAVLVLYDIDEVPMKDIADALGIPLHTGYSRLRRAREQCAEAVKRLRRKETRDD